MPYFGNTIESCEGIACSRCKINIDFCQCQPRKLEYRRLSERITAQGMVPATYDERKAA